MTTNRDLPASPPATGKPNCLNRADDACGLCGWGVGRDKECPYAPVPASPRETPQERCELLTGELRCPCILPRYHAGMCRAVEDGVQFSSPAPGAPGVDFEKAMDELGSVVWAFHAKEHKADFRALVTRIREGHRALIDAAVAQARAEEQEHGVRESLRLQGLIEASYAPLLAAVAEWQEARKAKAGATLATEPTEWTAICDRYYKAKDALAALPLPLPRTE